MTSAKILKGVRNMIVKGLILWLVGLALGGILLSGNISAQANADLTYALEHTPQGIPLQQYFEIGTSLNNHARIVDSNTQATVNTQAVELTNSTNQVGSIWSTDNNTFDLDNEQVASMWLYFGDGGSDSTDDESSKNNTAGDGMAFVLQNDSRGTAATTKMPKIYGETLGVWGYDDENNRKESPISVAQSAIQNSWALEFDTHMNLRSQYDSLTGPGNSYDIDNSVEKPKHPHIASNYPGDVNSYHVGKVYHTHDGKPNLWSGNDWRSYVSLNHNGLIMGQNFNFLSNKHWHHLTLKYEPQRNGDSKTGNMTYTFNDKDPETGAPLAGRSQNVPIDKSKITDKDHPHTARWGFTGATGSSYENNLVVFEQIPDLVDVSADAQLTSLTQNKKIQENDTVKEHDSVQLDYMIKYLGGKSEWHDVVANLELPKHIKYLGGKITYSGQDNATETITFKDFSAATLIRKLSHIFNRNRSHVKISLKGEVAEGAGKVSAATSSFKGTEAVAEATVPSFRVAPLKFLELRLTNESTQDVDEGQFVKIAGNVAVQDENLKNPDLKLHVKSNGREVYNQPLSGSDAFGVIDQKLQSFLFTENKNDVTVWVTDSQGHVSDPIALTVYLGRLALKSVTGNLNFSGQLNGRTQLLKSQEPFSVSVEDTRKASGSGWHLEAAATALNKDDATGQPLAGQLLYKASGLTTVLSDSAQNVISHTNSERTVPNQLTTTDPDQGFYLQVDGGAAGGTYTGRINWTLGNTP